MESPSITLEIRNDSDLVKILEFLHTSKVHFQIQEFEAFQRTLFQGIDSEKVQPSWVRHENFRIHLETIENELSQNLIDEKVSKNDVTEVEEHLNHIREFRKLVNKELSGELMKTYFSPTEHFKVYCGPEWLTSKGKITPRGVLNFIDMQLKIRDISVVNGVIHTNEWLRTLLEDGREFIMYDELPRIVFRLLKK